MSTMQTEWSLQKQLTRSWLERGLVELDSEPFFLAAWELMTNFKVNDSRRHWNKPSIDFVLLDRSGHIALVELKRDVRTPREAWSVLCQVTHRAQVLSMEFTQDGLDSAYLDCHSGLDGRASRPQPVGSLLDAHARAFNQTRLEELPGLPMRRFVMAQTFGDSFSEILHTMNGENKDRIVTQLARYKPRGEIRRYLNLPRELQVGGHPIRAVTVDGVPAPSRSNES